MDTEKQEKEKIKKIPYCSINAGPRNRNWDNRLKEELNALISYVKLNKKNDNHWFYVKPVNKKGIEWEGKIWYFYENIKYELILKFDIPVTYPVTCPDFRIPELIGKTKKMYQGGAICQTLHFKPLWSKNVPKFGIAHGLGPWLAAEIPVLVSQGKLKKK